MSEINIVNAEAFRIVDVETFKRNRRYIGNIKMNATILPVYEYEGINIIHKFSNYYTTIDISLYEVLGMV